MLKALGYQLKVAFLLVTVLSLLTGVIYPLAVTAFAQFFFPWQANGSLIEHHGQPIGSLLIGQPFSGNQYFWGRPSETGVYPYNGEFSKASNLGPTNPELVAKVKARVARLEVVSLQKDHPLPVGLVTASASGLDPDISPFAAFYQIPRVAKARHLSENELESIIVSYLQDRWMGLLGEPRINVLLLNLALDKLTIRNSNE
jgi:K+-transporting ATPase ATPase C chain